MQRSEYDYKLMTAARLLLGLAFAAVLAAVVAVLLLWRQGSAGMAGAVLACLLALVLVVVAVWRLPQAGLGFEWQVRRRFRAVCREKGLAKQAGEAVSFPMAARLSGSRDGFRMTVRPLLGQSLADWERAAAAFTLAYGATGTRFRNDGGGRLTMFVGYQKLDSHEFLMTGEAGAAAPGVTWRDRLARVEVGTAEGGQPFFLPLLDSHILCAGMTGAGKGSLIWSLLLRLVPAYEAGVVRFWGFDPKRMELSIGRQFFADRYAADSEAMVALLEAAHDEMQARADELAGQVRRFEPSPAHPLHVLVVDELGYLSALLPDRKLRDRVEKALSGILVLGRAVGFVVIGALQDPRKENLSFRDLFPTRVAMRLPKPMVDLVLGHGMYEAGAQCDLIPPREHGAGVAFVVDESSTLPVCVRMSWCSDELIRATAARLLPPSPDSAPRLRPVT
jgi:DNA segregation ATPase FtsK/SpoIIIE, S-DNA-T family